MAKFQFYPVSITYKVSGDMASVYLFGRTKDNKQICVVDSSLKPYFYVMPKEESVREKLLKISVENKDNLFKVTDVTKAKRKYFGKSVDVLKVYVNLPAGVPLIREVIKEWDIIEDIF